MTLFDLKAHLKTMTEAHAPSGHEGPVREIIRQSWTPFVDEFDQDRLGSLIGIKRATRPLNPPRRIMLAAHMDEIGLMVREILDGFILVQRVAGMDQRTLLGQAVIVHGRQPLPGIVATVPPHLLKPEDRLRYPSFDDLVIDLGLPAETVNTLVRVGDLVTPDAEMIELSDKLLAAKAFDDRACVAAVSVCLHELQGMQHAWDVYATATVQEETGLLGARTAAQHIGPDVAIALDVSFAEQSGVPADSACEINGGPVITLGGNIHPRLYQHIIDTARRYEIKTQTEALPGPTGTDAWAIQVARDGIPTALISVPLRNMHSAVETLDIRDVERAGRLLAHFIANLDAGFLAEIDWQDELENGEEAIAEAEENSNGLEKA